MKHIEVVSAIFHNDEDKTIYATQRGYGNYAGWWEFPGGKIEPDEDPQVALVREIREELAVDIEIERPFVTVNFLYPEYDMTMQCFLCKFKDGEPTLLEHSAACWVSRENIDSLKWLGADIEIIARMKDEGIL